MRRLQAILIGIGVASLISHSIVLFITFILAYFQGYKIIIDINKYGEAHLEIIIIPITIALGIYSVYFLFKSVSKKAPSNI
jgi:hypothetical protein